MPRPVNIAETALYVDDLGGTAEFYAKLFDCQILRYDGRFCALRIADEQVLLLFLRGASTEPSPIFGSFIPPHDGSGPLHVCFGIRADELSQWEAHLQTLNIPIESRVNWPSGAVSLYFRDPAQHAVELATPGVWL